MNKASLEKLLDTMINDIKKHMPILNTCAVYPVLRKPIKAPAVLLEVTGYEVDDDTGTEEMMLNVEFEAFAIAGCDQNPMASAKMAQELLKLIHNNNWGYDIGPSKFQTCGPRGFKPELDAYHVWSVTWENLMPVGENVWDTSGITPRTIYVGEKPLVS